MKKKPLLIGEAPGRNGDPHNPLDSLRLSSLFGLSRQNYMAVTARTNLFKSWPGSDGEGDFFPIATARFQAEAMDISGRDVILLGKRVAEAFQVRTEYFELHRAKEIRSNIWVIPHHSGRNRWWNSEVNRKRAQDFCRKWMAERLAELAGEYFAIFSGERAQEFPIMRVGDLRAAIFEAEDQMEVLIRTDWQGDKPRGVVFRATGASVECGCTDTDSLVIEADQGGDE